VKGLENLKKVGLGFMLVRQVLYSLSHAASPRRRAFCMLTPILINLRKAFLLQGL
jgi:hypothetical protein